MRQALAAEVARAREQRLLIRRLDAEGLVQRARLRAEFNTTLAELQAALAQHLTAGAAAFSLTELSIDQLRRRAPREGRRLADTLAEVRGLAGALQELDTLNRMLAERALACVRGYVSALTAQPAAYDRRGLATAGSALRTASRVA
jgi:hypothetical protein